MSSCSDCRLWLTMRVTDYEDGTRIVNFECEPGKGQCEVLKIETLSDFGCNKFELGAEHIEIMAKKTGSPWHHSHYESCPDCKGRGIPLGHEAPCGRCCGTGKVLHYDDGFIGEEKTRRHPNEETKGPPPVPTCVACGKNVEITWVSCPFCGAKQSAGDKPTRHGALTS